MSLIVTHLCALRDDFFVHCFCGHTNSFYSLFLVVQFIKKENSALHLF